MLAKIQLFIIPFSGSKASQFNKFCSDFDSDVIVETIEYAGRGKRAKEPFFTDYDAFINDICSFIKEHREYSIPFAILGYSIGGLFAYDLVAKEYLKEEPKHIFICACENNIKHFPPLSQLPEDEFWEKIIQLGGVDKKLIEHKKYLKLFSKTMRADFFIGEQHHYLKSDRSITCPVSVFYSESDTPYEDVRKWQKVCKGGISFHQFYGGHFFILEHHEQVAEEVKKRLGLDKMSKKRCWTEIDLQQIKKNYEVYKQTIPLSLEIMAVVKADAYGHGDKVVAKFLSDQGIRHFAVSNIDEAIHIRTAGAEGQILILGYTPIDRANDLITYDITQALISEEYAEEIENTGLPIKCEFALDTGMRRIGLNADEPEECEKVIRKYAHLLDGLFTHLCVADTPGQDEFTEGQIKKYEVVCKRVSDLNLPYCHCLNSAGGIWHKSEISCFARFGIILYGLKPDFMNTLPEGIEPALSWKSVVSMVKDVRPGDTIGYGRSFEVKKSMRIATIPTGYADGYSRLLSNKGYVLINGKKASIVGRVCMDQVMVDVSEIDNVGLGTNVVLIGKSGNEVLTADDLANIYGTIGYEVVCGISKRVDRDYI